MSKMKKLLAMFLTLAMVLGMSVTTMAADATSPYVADITVNGLAANDDTTVNVFAAITLDSKANSWVIADWATPYINSTTYEITDEKALAEAAATKTAVSGIQIKEAGNVVVGEYDITVNSNGTVVIFNDLPVGAYVIVAAGNKATYTAMVAETYDEDATYMAAVDVTIDAKTSGYVVDKKAEDDFVAVGQPVEFEVTTVFPSFENANSTANTFKIYDIPTNLTLDVNSVVVTIGNDPLTKGTNYTVSATVPAGISKDVVADTTGLLIDLTNSIIGNNGNAGKIVTITYTGTVTGTTENKVAYANNAYSNRNGVDIGSDGTKGFTGDITVTKTDDSADKNLLNGAKFKVYAGTKDEVKAEGSKLTALGFVLLKNADENEGVTLYRLATETDAANTIVTEIVAEKGTVKVTGLDEGNYWFEETEAPKGYSINDAGVPVSIDEPNEAKHVSVAGTIADTKLSSLPSTGGIGTTIFTIAGCGIMIAAAYLFFVSRRKEA